VLDLRFLVVAHRNAEVPLPTRCFCCPLLHIVPTDIDVAGGSRPASQSKIPLSAAGANKGSVKIDDRLRRLANFTYLARLFDAITP
jgi:hypothetical protein